MLATLTIEEGAEWEVRIMPAGNGSGSLDRSDRMTNGVPERALA
jgi:hypothetical protein